MEPPANPPPSPAVLLAFNLTGTLTPLSSGMGTSYLLSSPTTAKPIAVLKPVIPPNSPPDPLLVAEVTWSNSLLARLSTTPSRAFLLPTPLPTTADRSCYIADNWTASTFISGQDVYSPALRARLPAACWATILAASRALHAQLRDVPKPDFVDARSHLWAVADRVAWGEVSVLGLRGGDVGEEDAAGVVVVNPLLMPVLRRLWALRREFREGEDQKCQIVHGDLSGNVLLCEEEGKKPGIIDFTPYWRPVRSAESVVVADAMINFNLGGGLVLELGFGDEEGLQMLVRGVVFRLVAHSGLRKLQGQSVSGEEVQEFENAAVVLKGLME